MTMTNGRVLADLSSKTQDELLSIISGLQAKVERAGNRKLTIKVSDKGGCSVYGLGRFPVTLYASQWRKLLGAAAEIETFLTDNQDRLSEKD